MFIDEARDLVEAVSGTRQILLESLQMAELKHRLGDLSADKLELARVAWQEAHQDPELFNQVNEALLTELHDEVLSRQLHELYLALASFQDDPELAREEVALRTQAEELLLKSNPILQGRAHRPSDLDRVFKDSRLGEERQLVWTALVEARLPAAKMQEKACRLEDERSTLAGYSCAIDRELALRGFELEEWTRWLVECSDALMDWCSKKIHPHLTTLSEGLSGVDSAELLLGSLWPQRGELQSAEEVDATSLLRDTCDLLGLESNPVIERIRMDLADLPEGLRGGLSAPDGQLPFVLLNIQSGSGRDLDELFHAAGDSLARAQPGEEALPFLGQTLPGVAEACGAILQRISESPVWIRRLMGRQPREDVETDPSLVSVCRLLRINMLLQIRLDLSMDGSLELSWMQRRKQLLGSFYGEASVTSWCLDPWLTLPAAKLVDMWTGELLALHLMFVWRQRHGQDLLNPETGGSLLALSESGRRYPLEDLLEQLGLPWLNPAALLDMLKSA